MYKPLSDARNELPRCWNLVLHTGRNIIYLLIPFVMRGRSMSKKWFIYNLPVTRNNTVLSLVLHQGKVLPVIDSMANNHLL